MWLSVSSICVMVDVAEPECHRESGWFRADLSDCTELRAPMKAYLTEKMEALHMTVIYAETICARGIDL